MDGTLKVIGLSSVVHSIRHGTNGIVKLRK